MKIIYFIKRRSFCIYYVIQIYDVTYNHLLRHQQTIKIIGLSRVDQSNRHCLVVVGLNQRQTDATATIQISLQLSQLRQQKSLFYIIASKINNTMHKRPITLFYQQFQYLPYLPAYHVFFHRIFRTFTPDQTTKLYSDYFYVILNLTSSNMIIQIQI